MEESKGLGFFPCTHIGWGAHPHPPPIRVARYTGGGRATIKASYRSHHLKALILYPTSTLPSLW